MQKLFLQKNLSPDKKVNFEEWVKTLQVNLDEQEEINSQTLGQRQNYSWIEARVGRITGSKVGSVLKADTPVKKSLAAKEVFGLSKIPFYAKTAINWGITNEETAKKTFLEDYAIKSHEEKGLLVDETGVLAISPDLLCTNSVTNQQFLLEIKCPYSIRQYESLDKALFAKPRFYIGKVVKTDGSIGYALKVDTDQGFMYYSQIMLSLYVSKLPYAVLYVWTPHFSQDILIRRNSEWEKENIPKLVAFWKQQIAPELFKNQQQLRLSSLPDKNEETPPEKKLCIAENKED